MPESVVNINRMTDEQKAAFKRGDPQYVYIGAAHTLYGGALVLKASKWANKHAGKIADICKQRKCSIAEAMQATNELYRADLLNNAKLLKALPELRGKTLVDFAPPLPSHGDILIELLNSVESK